MSEVECSNTSLLHSGVWRGGGTVDALEARAARAGRTATVLDSSLLAERSYGHRGYTVTSHGEHRVTDQDGQLVAVLVYAIMEKHLGGIEK